jgi:5S rRNA maturation endonuclease (ribonuclease M5)
VIGSERKFEEFVGFLVGFIQELNELSSQQGALVLVEGKRDRKALSDLGYAGLMITKAVLHSEGGGAIVRRAKLVIIMTDFDQEGRRLASLYARYFTRRNISISLEPRRRLLRASHGIFLHVENLARFVPVVAETTITTTIGKIMPTASPVRSPPEPPAAADGERSGAQADEPSVPGP